MLLALVAAIPVSSPSEYSASGPRLQSRLSSLCSANASPRHSVRLRNFYGILQVAEVGAADAVYRSLFNGTIQHGVQFMMPDRSRIPTTYYGRASGVAIVSTSSATGRCASG